MLKIIGNAKHVRFFAVLFICSGILVACESTSSSPSDAHESPLGSEDSAQFKFEYGLDTNAASSFVTVQADAELYKSAKDLIVDEEGNVYVIGEFTEDLDLGDGEVIPEDRYISSFIASYNQAGELRWKDVMRGACSESSVSSHKALSLARDSAGDLYVSSRWDCPGVTRVSVRSYTADGEVRWSRAPVQQSCAVRSFGASCRQDIGRFIRVGDDGRVILAGSYFYLLELENGGHIMAGTTSRVYVASLDSSDGSLQWVKSPRHTSSAEWTQVEIDAQRSAIYLSGRYKSEFARNHELDWEHCGDEKDKYGSCSAEFIERRSLTDGEVGWRIEEKSRYLSTGLSHRLAVSPNGHIYFSAVAGKNTLFFSYSENGELRWQTRLQSRVRSRTRVITVDSILVSGSNEIYVGGKYRGRLEWGDNELQSSREDGQNGYLIKLSEDNQVLANVSLWAAWHPEVAIASTVQDLSFDGNGDIRALVYHYNHSNLEWKRFDRKMVLTLSE